MADNNKPLTEEEISNWSREAYKKATSFLGEKGVVAESVSMEQSRYLAPLLAVWKIKATDKKWFWVISGDLPTDVLPEESAKTAREAIKSFSYKWQLDSEKVLAGQMPTAHPEQFAGLLQNRAENLFEISENEALWNNG